MNAKQEAEKHLTDLYDNERTCRDYIIEDLLKELEATECTLAEKVRYIEAQVDELNELKSKLAEAEKVVEAVKPLLIQVSAEPIGKMSGMADQTKRLEWFGEIRVIRIALEKALSDYEASKGE